MRILKILAILALVITLLGAGTLLYTLETRTPKATETFPEIVNATADIARFEGYRNALEEERYAGRVFSSEDLLDAGQYTFLNIRLRLANNCLLPMEWITAEVVPEEGDVLEARDQNPHVLNARSSGDLTLQVLTHQDTLGQGRRIKISYYILGQKYETEIQVTF
ncbi:MAG: hypothetical protein IJ719_09720 [Clostridia bacterium]|nr:hypothetical protein [Clostridia bacterium]